MDTDGRWICGPKKAFESPARESENQRGLLVREEPHRCKWQGPLRPLYCCREETGGETGEVVLRV